MSKLLLLLTITAVLAWPTTAEAHRARAAQTPSQLIQRAVGPGTVVTSCRRIELGSRCDYSTPASNVFEGEVEGWTWASYADVIRGRVLFP